MPRARRDSARTITRFCVKAPARALALAFGAGHLGTLFIITGATSLSEVSPVLLGEMFLLNGIVGLVAGERYMKDGLVAAAGVHFWADMVFHVLWGLF